MSDSKAAFRERPILFSGPMVRAILAGKKTQTRRIINPQPVATPWGTSGGITVAPALLWDERGAYARAAESIPATDRLPGPYGVNLIGSESRLCPYGKPGDRLWVRETWQMNEPPSGAIYRADDITGHIDGGWRPSIFMPRWASRLILEVTGVRVERLQEITEKDILAEGVTVDLAAKMTGVPWSSLPTMHHAWAAGWDLINDKRAPWASNPWVWVIEFRAVSK